MKSWIVITVLALTAPTLVAQELNTPENPKGAATETEIARHIEKLGSPDFDVREDAADALRAIGEPALKALERALDAPGENIERTLLLEEVVSDIRKAMSRAPRPRRDTEIPAPPAQARPRREQALPQPEPFTPFGGQGRDLFEEMTKRLQDMMKRMGVEMPSPFGPPDSPAPDAPLEEGPVLTPGEQSPPDAARPRFDFQPRIRIFGGGGPGSSLTVQNDRERISYRQTEDGAIQVRISEKSDEGKWTSQRYDAKDEAEFRDKYPDVYRRVKEIGGFGGEQGAQTSPFQGMPDPREMFPPEMRDLFRDVPGLRADPGPVPEQAPMPEYEVIEGAVVEPLSDSLRAHLDLSQGLVIKEYRVAGSLFERAGIPPHGIVLAIDGIGVSSAEQARQALADIPKGRAISVEALVKGERRHLTVTR